MKGIHLDTPMKLVAKNNNPHQLFTQFVVDIPEEVLKGENLHVVCELTGNKSMQYELSDNVSNVLNNAYQDKDKILKQIEFHLWNASTLKKVSLKNNEEAYLLKQGIFIKY